LRDEVDKVIKRIHELPTLPLVYKRVSDLLRNPYTSASDVAAVISEDQVITTKLLRLVNSAHYGFAEKVETITRAVSLVGMQAVKDLVLATSVMDLFHNDDAGDWTVVEFWRHSLAVAVASSAIAEAVDDPCVEEYFVAGLIHDIGKIVWIEYFQPEFYEVLALAKDKRMPMIEAEKQRLGFTHARAGRLLAKRWKLPERLIETIAWHHDPRLADKNPRFPALVHVADVIANAMHLGKSGNGCVPPLSPEALEICGLKPQDVPQLMPLIQESYKDSILVLSFWDASEKSEIEGDLSSV
jgi:putative nucleotidyltransferase with HDIG domain